MGIPQAITAGLAGEKLSRTLTGTSEVSAGRSIVATASSAALGAVSVGALSVGTTVLAAGAAPVVVPVAIAASVVGLIRSLFD